MAVRRFLLSSTVRIIVWTVNGGSTPTIGPIIPVKGIVVPRKADLTVGIMCVVPGPLIIAPCDTASCTVPIANAIMWSPSNDNRSKPGEQGWRSVESTRLPPMWPGFDSRTRRHTWVEFVVGSLLCAERFFSGYSGFLLSAKTNISKIQFDPECSSVSYMSPGFGRLGNHSSRYEA